jgi:hypothetical protein
VDNELDSFAELLVRHVRDRSIEVCDHHAAGNMRGPSGLRWDDALQLSAGEAIAELIPDIVDEVVFELLNAIDNDVLPLALLGGHTEPTALNDVGLGEMAGWYASGEWPRRFSSARWSNLLGDLKLRDDE